MGHPISMSKDQPRLRESRTRAFTSQKKLNASAYTPGILPVLRNPFEDDPEIITGCIIPCWIPLTCLFLQGQIKFGTCPKYIAPQGQKHTLRRLFQSARFYSVFRTQLEDDPEIITG